MIFIYKVSGYYHSQESMLPSNRALHRCFDEIELGFDGFHRNASIFIFLLTCSAFFHLTEDRFEPKKQPQAVNIEAIATIATSLS